MRVATAKQMAQIDRQTIAGGVPGSELMERAGQELTRRLLDLFPELAPPARLLICCGKGNNGGDGLVMARLLDGLGFQITVMLLALPEDLSADARLNHDRLPGHIQPHVFPPDDWAASWVDLAADADLTIDAIFGTGIQPPVRAHHAALFQAINERGTPVLSVDIPSGACGESGRVDPVAVQADATVTIGLPKLGLFLPPARDHCGRLEVVDIGFTEAVIREHTGEVHYFCDADYARLLPARSSDVHKYRCGTLLVLAGSTSYGGAAVLAGLGALRSGVGLVTVGVPSPVEIPTRVGLPEALIASLPATAAGTMAPLDRRSRNELTERKQAVALGPGLGAVEETDRWILDWQAELDLPLVVDADGLSAWGRQNRTPAFVSPQVVLTPHAGELARILRIEAAEIDRNRMELVPELAHHWGVTLLLKGSPTLIADPAGVLTINTTGDDALAHGGTGDVLTGLIGGLLAQGTSARDAAVLGAYLHGKAGQNAADFISRRSVLARDVAAGLGDALADLEDLQPQLGGGVQGSRA